MTARLLGQRAISPSVTTAGAAVKIEVKDIPAMKLPSISSSFVDVKTLIALQMTLYAWTGACFCGNIPQCPSESPLIHLRRGPWGNTSNLFHRHSTSSQVNQRGFG